MSATIAHSDARRTTLEHGLKALKLEVGSDTVAQLLRFLDLLQKWNRVYNLTAVRDPQEMVTQHLLDSLTAVPWINGTRVLDVGSGAGFPGIPIALVKPHVQMTLLEVVEKKTAFLQQAATELQLPNVTVVRERVEMWRPAEDFDVVVARAFAALDEFVAVAGHLVRSGGRLVAMKGSYPAVEVERLPAGVRVVEAAPVSIPGVDAARHIIVMAMQGNA